MANKSVKPIAQRAASALLLIGIVVYAILQLVALFSKDVEIARLRAYTVEEKLTATALFFRDETVLTAPSGRCAYAVENRSRVAAGDRIAVIYAESGDTTLADKLAKLETQLDSLLEIYESGSGFDYDVTRLDEQINSAIYSILDAADYNNAVKAQSNIRELSKLMNKRLLIDGNAQVTLEQISDVRGQINALMSNSGNILKTVESPAPGFFVSQYDGMEGTLPVSASENLTVGALSGYLEKNTDTNVPANYVGAVVDGYIWRCAFILPESTQTAAGDYLLLRFPEYSDGTVRAPVLSVSEPVDGQVAVVVESAREMGLHLNARRQSVEIITSRQSGYRVSKNAIKYEDGATGVYVVKGQILTYTPVTITYTSDEYVLLDSGSDSKVVEHDDVVIAGRDLYDGKIVKSG